MKQNYIGFVCLIIGLILGFGIGWKYAENKLIKDINTFVEQELKKLDDAGQGLMFYRPGKLEYQNGQIVERK